MGHSHYYCPRHKKSPKQDFHLISRKKKQGSMNSEETGHLQPYSAFQRNRPLVRAAVIVLNRAAQ